MTNSERIEICEKTRNIARRIIKDAMGKFEASNEVEFRDYLADGLKHNSNLFDEGWYSPPPFGVSVLFVPKNLPERSKFDSLRKEEYWPKDIYKFEKESVGFIYISPVDKETGMIGDIGLTLYRGDDPKIRQHILTSMKISEQSIDRIEVGMNLKELHDYVKNLMTEKGCSNRWLATFHDKVGNNYGHTIPWSYEEQSIEEKSIIASGDIEKAKSVISHKRLYINKESQLKVLPDMAFTFEISIGDDNDNSLPNVYYHYIVTFRNGEKKVLGGFNEIFKAVGMDSWITSKY